MHHCTSDSSCVGKFVPDAAHNRDLYKRQTGLPDRNPQPPPLFQHVQLLPIFVATLRAHGLQRLLRA